MTADEARKILDGSCLRKRTQMARGRARLEAEALAAREGRPMEAYRCPFAAATGTHEHWHVGSTPTLEQLARIALAIRWFHEHPDDVR